MAATCSSNKPSNTSVTIRFTPLSERAHQQKADDEIAWYADGDKLVHNVYPPLTSYTFDRVFRSSVSTKEVYQVAARPIVKAAMEGVNGTVFGYGVTSGKTHTMHGDHNSPGLIRLAIKDIFSIIQDTPGKEFLVWVSYIEIYNEVIIDLLDPRGQNICVQEDSQGTYVKGIKKEVVLSPTHALSFITSGHEHRHVGSNNFDSRSHTIFTLVIESWGNGDEFDGVKYSRLNLVDLAGSENLKAETTELRRKEGSYINKSLLTLGTVMAKLSERKASHFPYRDSKLTRLLQSSLSGNGHVSLICTISATSSNKEETQNTLKFASRAKHVEINASRNEINKPEHAIEERIKQMENQIISSIQALSSNTSLFDMRMTIRHLMTQCDEEDFGLEIKSSYIQVLEEQLHNKMLENEKLRQEHLKVLNDNQQLMEEASYAAAELTTLTLQNTKIEKELVAAREVLEDLSSCKVCFESRSAAVLLPCRHFGLCKACSLACSKCPFCRTMIADRIFGISC